MNNFEWLQSLSPSELAEWLCPMLNCDECPAKNTCSGLGIQNFEYWLLQKQNPFTRVSNLITKLVERWKRKLKL